MIKKTFIGVLSVLLSVCIYADIHLDKPVINETLTIGSEYHIQWHGPASEADQLVTIFIQLVGENQVEIIDNTHTKADGGFIWKVGHLQDGTYIPSGAYNLSLETWDGDTGHSITLEYRQLKIQIRDLYERVIWIPVIPDPPFRMGFKLNLKHLKIRRGKINESHVLKLFKNNKFVALLGKVNKRQSLPNFAPIKLTRMQKNKLKKEGQSKFQLRIFNLKGKLLHKQDVALKLTKQQMLKLKNSKLKLKQRR